MATVRAQRLLNSLMSGTTTGAQLQTLLGTASNMADYQQLLVERGKARLLTNTTNGFTATMQSDLAFVEYTKFPTCTTEFKTSSIAKGIYAANASYVRDSSARMSTVFQNSDLRAVTYASGFTAETTIFSSQYMQPQWQYFYNKGATEMPQPVGRSTPSTAGSMRGVAYGNGVWVIVGQGTNKAIRSTDNAVTWALGSDAVSDATGLNAVAYGAGVFVAVGDTGRVITSADGNANWVARTSGTANNFLNVKFGNGVFVAVTSNAIYTSPDGITWTARATGLTINGGLDFGSGKWFVGGTNNFYTSTNNTTWTSQVPAGGPYTGSPISSIVHGNGIWVASINTFYFASQYYTAFFYSTDNGVTWSFFQTMNQASAQQLTGPAVYANGLFMITSNGGRLSVNGSTWESTVATIGSWATTLSTSLTINGMAYGNGQMVAVHSSSAYIYTMF